MYEHKCRFFKDYCYSLISVCLVLGIVVAVCMSYFADCNEVCRGVLRLHVIAQSDSAQDQSVKLKVRDALLLKSAELFDGSVNVEQAEQKIAPALSQLEAIADEVLRENGMNYMSKAELVYEYFDVRAYGDITLPAGYYTALKVVLGDGQGKNWWCVMFPPLCLPCAQNADTDESFAVFYQNSEVVQAKNGYQIRFKVAELAQKALHWLKEKYE